MGGFEKPSADRLVRLLRESDIGITCDAKLDRGFDFRPPDPAPALTEFEGRGKYDRELLKAIHTDLSKDIASLKGTARFQKHRDYVTTIRRLHFFECRDGSWKSLLPYKAAERMLELIKGKQDPKAAAGEVIRAINRGEGVFDSNRLTGKLALQVRQVEGGTMRCYRVFPADQFTRLSTVSLLDFKSIEMDRVLTGLFARIKHGGYDSRLSQAELHTIETFADEFLDEKDSKKFRGFKNHKRVLKQWLETHLLDLVNRGKPGQAVAAPRPLHGYTYRFRNSKHCRDYGAAPQIYELLWSARKEAGKLALDRLRQFFFEGVDSATNKVDCSMEMDVETQALLSALTPDKVTQDAQKPNTRELHDPICIGSADLMANDILRLMSYRAVIPRSVMVEYLKILLAFHLALYHLRLLKILPTLVKRKAAEPLCQRDQCPVKPSAVNDPFGDCPHRIGLFVDVAGKPDNRIARLAVQSADVHYRRIPQFVRANYVARKLDEFGRNLLALGKIQGGTKKQLAIWELLQLLDAARTQERDEFFGMRLMIMAEERKGEDDTIDPEIQRVVGLKLGKMDTYIECLVALRGDYHRSFIVRALDSFMLKNRPGALLAQTRAKGAPRRFVLDSRLLEVLLQLAVLEVNGAQGFYTREIKIEDLLVFLRERYGIFINTLPAGEGFGAPSIEDREALRQNKAAFKDKLREIGFFQDLSDAYVTQHVTPRYRIEKAPADAPAPTGGVA